MSRTPETITLAILQYACDLVESDSAKSLSVLRLAANLRKNVHEIDSGGKAAPEMEALLSAGSFMKGDELVRAVTDDIVSDESASDSRLEP